MIVREGREVSRVEGPSISEVKRLGRYQGFKTNAERVLAYIRVFAERKPGASRVDEMMSLLSSEERSRW